MLNLEILFFYTISLLDSAVALCCLMILDVTFVIY